MIKDIAPAVEGAISVPPWRSLLFVPAHIPRFVETPHERGADGFILDLEDSVPQDQKVEARRQLPESVAKVARKGCIRFGSRQSWFARLGRRSRCSRDRWG
ncbi:MULTISPECIES: aldolase/citrate lyase family protein [unclassified Mesorhizobium]|uniref:aldolase/citrate lyase family protein n=1 Tax=unclassified Mesorhizobium TaxID=325217 RepID=UPI002477D056|nr:aldolase/citrate lyase family protein [Mesorhizobium sp. LSJC285A00]